MKLKIAILGTRGIPNQYGGFEQFAENFAVRFAAKGYEVVVYTSSAHSYKASSFQGVTLIRCFDPENKIGTAGQFIYDFNCILDSRKRNFDVILQLGYTSSTIWSWLFPKDALIVTNMDGLEWTRAKYNKPTQYFLRYAEKWGAAYSHHLIADSRAIQSYLLTKYQINASFISYGATLFSPLENSCDELKKYKLHPYQYDLLIARFEPENNIEIILNGYASNAHQTLLIVGNYAANAFGKRMYKKFSRHHNIYFAGAVFDIYTLNVLRYYSRLYIHGHSVGGTNPSLLEAMAGNALIAAHDNIFNRDVLQEEAFYFKNEADLKNIVAKNFDKNNYKHWLNANREKITEHYNWEKITDQLEILFLEWMRKSG